MEPRIPPVKSLQYAGQIERLRAKSWDLELNVEPCIPPVNTARHNGQIERLHTPYEDRGMA